jgi:hypothetical protein
LQTPFSAAWIANDPNGVTVDRQASRREPFQAGGYTLYLKTCDNIEGRSISPNRPP